MDQFRLSSLDLDRFHAASFDSNPLHLSEAYARKSPYGERVAYGVLGIVAVLSRLSPAGERRLVEIAADFHNPMFLDVSYSVQVSGTDARRVATVLDGRDVVMTLVASFGHEPPTPYGSMGAVPPPEAIPASRLPETMAPGEAVGGSYRPSPDALSALSASLEVPSTLGQFELAALLWCSYVVGMQLPGERALFSRLKLTFSPHHARPDMAIDYRAHVNRFDERFNLAVIGAELDIAGERFASGELRAFVREDLPATGYARLATLVPEGEPLAGRVALVTGGSRGLGARIVQGLALAGCRVVANFRRGAADLEHVIEELGSGGERVRGSQGHAGDAAWAASCREWIEREYGGLDILVCNAALPLRPMALHPNSAVRLSTYVAESVALASTPLATFAEVLARQRGTAVMVSSAAVDEPPADWPHYVSAKAAVEGLTRVATLQFPEMRTLIVRPPRLLTDLTNTPSPLGRQGALAPEIVAAAIVDRLSDSDRERVEVLTQFTQND